MRELYERRRPPLIFAGAVLLIVCVAIARLPGSLVDSMERTRALESAAAAGWAYRLMALVAVVQALYGGFVIFRIEQVRRTRERDPRVGAMGKPRVITWLSRTAATMVCLTLVYGIAAFVVTGQRGGFWLFPMICVAQGAWYFREIGTIARWLGFQPAADSGPATAVWQREGPDYCPPIARGLVPLGREPAPEAE
ncbi:MAG TPA: hypothetical protein VFK89_03895 [Actinomycetota bacterium]|nr:hypothetical protein [Actinomycetota bacterium]